MSPRRFLACLALLPSLALPMAAHGGSSRCNWGPPPPGAAPAAPGGASPGASPRARPGAPTTPSGPLGSPSAGPGVTGTLPGVTTASGAALGPDLSSWNLWWDLNKAPYLALKAHVHAGQGTGGDAAFLGAGTGRWTLAPSAEEVSAQVVPALLEVLERETNNDLVSGALVALAKIGADGGTDSARIEAALARHLNDANQELRETAAVSLGILAHSRSIPLLANVLWDTAEGRERVGGHEVDLRTRAFAAYGLGLIGARTDAASDREVIASALRNALERDATSTHDLSVACVLALSIVPDVEFGEGAAQLEPLLELLRDRKRPVVLRAQCPIALARLLAGAPDEGREAVRARIAGELVALLRRKQELPELRQSCILALGELGTNDGERALDVEIRATLRGALADSAENQARGFVLIALAQGAARPGAEPAAGGLAESAEFLLAQLSDGKQMVRAWAGLACGVLGHELVRTGSGAATLDRLRHGVRAALADERDPSDLGAYATAAGLLSDQESAPLLRRALAQSLPDEARGWVAVGLGLLGQREARASLEALLDTSLYRPVLLRECAIALALLEDEDAAPQLVRLLRQANGVAAQTTISTALGSIGDRRSLAPLLAALHDTSRSERARGYAAVALGNVADKEPLPWNTKLALGLNYRASTATLTDPVVGGGILDIF